MLYREVTAVCSQICTNHINAICGKNLKNWNVKPGGTFSYHAFERLMMYLSDLILSQPRAELQQYSPGVRASRMTLPSSGGAEQ
jgi:hypothetical protein